MSVFDLCGDLRGGGKDDRAGVSGVEAKLGRRKGKDDGHWQGLLNNSLVPFLPSHACNDLLAPLKHRY